MENQNNYNTLNTLNNLNNLQTIQNELTTELQNINPIQMTEQEPNNEIILHAINVNQQMPEGISEVNDFFETLEKIREHQQMIELNGSANDTEMEIEEDEDSSSEDEKKGKKDKSKKDKKKKDKKKKEKKSKDKEKEKKKEKEKEKKPKKKEEKEKKQKKAKKLTKDQIIKGIKNGELVIVQSDQYDKLLRTAHKLQKRILRMIPLDKK